MDVDILNLILWIPGLLFALTIHELSHGLIASKLGDPTAKHLGRLSLNPLPHIDIFGTIILPAILILSRSGFVFGWAKPVPVNPMNFSNPRRDMTLVSLAGPASNLLGAIALGIILRILVLLPFQSIEIIMKILFFALQINLILAIFNLIPIPPLDGSKIIFGLIPSITPEKFHQFEKVGPILLITLIIIGPMLGIPILGIIIGPFLGITEFLILGPNTLQAINFMLQG